MAEEEPLEMIKTEESENLSIVVSENGRRSYRFTTPLLEGYTLGRDPYREFRKGVNIITYQDDSLSTVNATLEANYAIYYENRKLWEAKGNVKVTKADGTRLYTQQLFWNSITKRIYSNVDTKVETDTDTFIGEGFESDEELNELRFRRLKGKMLVDTEQLLNDDSVSSDRKDVPDEGRGRSGDTGKRSAAADGGNGVAAGRSANPLREEGNASPSRRPEPAARRDPAVEERPMTGPIEEENVRSTGRMRPGVATAPVRERADRGDGSLLQDRSVSEQTK